MKNLVSFAAGLVFGLGLIVSGMTDPNVVIGFLDLFGQWNPQLMFVMAGAVMVNLALFRTILKKQRPRYADAFSLPTKKDLDTKLITGSALFGIGWGILGICPGPGIVNAVTLKPLFLIFGASMIAGMFVHKVVFKE